ncbi:hypothetical protein MUK42_04502 [Musa troglodytarum]|uniref:Uncharacterized protein n=1 Tax=Musa troglodytarum TaxID=320322 RepID=A0A9E7KJB8_9LILI|nr:hypothetical protein MUK42_04502 [Musa troglodytarum]
MDLVASLTICFIFLLHAFLAIKELPPQRRRQHVEGATEGPCEEGGVHEGSSSIVRKREQRRAMQARDEKEEVGSRLEWWGSHERG